MDNKSSVVIEIGGRYTKCGYSPESLPRFIIPTNLLPLNIATYLSSGTPFDIDPSKNNNGDETKNDNNNNDKGNNEMGIGSGENKVEKIKNKSPLPTSSQLKESLFIFFKTIFLNYLLCKPDERKIIVVENIFLPRKFRECLVSVLFEQYKVPLIVFINPTASLIPTLRTTALLIDCGYSETRVLPVFEGIGILKAFENISLGSESLINQLVIILSNSIFDGIILNNSTNEIITDKEVCNTQLQLIINSITILEDIIVRSCFCSFTNKHQKEGDNTTETVKINNIKYRLSKEYSIIIDGEEIRKGLIDRLYKKVDNDNIEEGNIATSIINSLMKCEHDQRKALTHSILLLGGTTILPGFKRRLVLELTKQINDNPIYKKQVGGLIGHFNFINHPFENNYLCWLGGSILATALEHVHSKITLESYLTAPSLYKRSQLIPEWEKLTNINNYTQIAQATIGTNINPLQFNSTSSLFSPFTSSNDLSNYLNKE